MRNRFRLARVGALLVVAPLLLALAGPASAASHAASHVSTVGVAARPAALPNVDIQGAPANFNPTSISVAPSAAKPGKKGCTKKRVRFTVTNTTTASQTITQNGTPIGAAIPAGDAEGICVFGKPGATGTLSLVSNPSASLKETLT